MSNYSVTLHLYDLSRGLAKQFSQQLLGKYIEGIWHSGIVYNEKEWYFGGGIFNDPKGRTPYGVPDKVIELGATQIPPELFSEFMEAIRPRFTMQSYDIIRHNCNNFTNEISIFLTGNPIPKFITDLPEEALNTPFGAMIRPFLDQYRNQVASFYEPNDNAPSALNQAFKVADKAAHAHEQLPLKVLLWNQPVLFTSGDLPQITSKLASFVENKENKDLNDLLSIASKNKTFSNSVFFTEQSIEFLIKLTRELPEDKSFPVLDLLRLVVTHSTYNTLLVNKYANVFTTLFRDYVSNPNSLKAKSIMTLRLAANVFAATAGQSLMVQMKETIVEMILKGLRESEESVKIAAATLVFNFSLYLPKTDTDTQVQLISALVHDLNEIYKNPPEAVAFTELMALGRLAYCNTEACELAKTLELNVEGLKQATSAKVKEAAGEVALLLT